VILTPAATYNLNYIGVRLASVTRSDIPELLCNIFVPYIPECLRLTPQCLTVTELYVYSPTHLITYTYVTIVSIIIRY